LVVALIHGFRCPSQQPFGVGPKEGQQGQENFHDDPSGRIVSKCGGQDPADDSSDGLLNGDTGIKLAFASSKRLLVGCRREYVLMRFVVSRNRTRNRHHLLVRVGDFRSATRPIDRAAVWNSTSKCSLVGIVVVVVIVFALFGLEFEAGGG
jgi:hypothetical protein